MQALARSKAGVGLVVGLLVACGDAGSKDEHGGDAGSDAPACNDLSNTAAVVEETKIAADPPMSASGGMIEEGRYHLTSYGKYVGTGGTVGPSGRTRQQTITLARTSETTLDMQSVLARDDGADDRVSYRLTLMGAGPDSMSMSMDITCPSPAYFGRLGYDATANTLTLYDSDENALLLYTRAP